MILKTFPNLAWLKEQAEQKFRNRKGWHQNELPDEGWPTVILNAHTQQESRPDIKGTLSLFLNISGTSECAADKHHARIDTSQYFLSNQHQYYSLEIDSEQPTETFNIHFSEKLLTGFYAGMVHSDDQLLNRVFDHSDTPIYFYNKSYQRDARFNELVQHLQQGPGKGMAFEEQTIDMLHYLLIRHRDVLREVAQIPAAKAATRAELYLRLSHAVDYIHSCYDKKIELDTLATVACLSKHHFLRLFRSTFHQTPHQYLTALRIEKACEALTHTPQPIYAIALNSGFENSSSFSRLFFKRMGCYPSQYRSLAG